MTRKRYEQLGMLDSIERRDFINGVLKGSLAVAASGLAPNVLAAAAGMPAAADGAAAAPPRGPYPPALTGMRGSGYPKAFAVGHEMRDGTLHIDESQVQDTGEEYDLVVVGGGISGLAAALYYSRDSGGTRTLVLDNHDDFGGHAKRNEFDFGSRTVMSNAGTFNMSPGSENTQEFLASIGIADLARLNRDNQDTFFYQRLGMGQSVYYDQATFGKDVLMGDPAPWIEFLAFHDPNMPPDQEKRWAEFLAHAPMSERARKDVYRLYTAKTDYLPGMTPAERVKKLRKTTYRDFLLEIAKVDPMVVSYLRDRTFGSARGLSGMSAMAARRRGMPGFLGMDLGPDNPLPQSALGLPPATTHKVVANYHFPDGNATIARLIVRQLVPEALPGKTLEDSILQRADYSRLDLPDNRNRIRLDSTAVQVANMPNGASVIYSRDGKLYRVRARHCVLACWHHVIPYICPELPEWQKEALRYQVHAANLWVNVWLRNWRAFEKAGACFINAPNGYYSQILLECPVDIGGYKRSASPDEPTVLTMLRVYETPGIPVKDQYRIARAEMYATDFETYELNVRDQLTRMLGPHGFDARRDIAGITVNRWGHGYSYMYSSVFDDFLDRGEQPPHERARMPYGNISIANCDAAGRDSTTDAIDQAHRAVCELRLNLRNSVAF